MKPKGTTAEIVCLVDDDEAVLRAISRLLSSDGFTVSAFREPKTFLSHVREHVVPVVVLDIWMEEMSGVDVQSALAKISPGTQVIIMTGRDDPVARKAVQKGGAAAFFTKPFDDEEFLGAVRRALRE